MKKKDVRKQLADAEKRLSELMNGHDELVEANEKRCRDLARKVAEGEVPEHELLTAQMLGESREHVQRSAAICFEEEVVRPLRQQVLELDVKEARAEIARLDEQAAAARAELSEFLDTAAIEEQRLRQSVNESEEQSARLQREVRRKQKIVG